MTRQLMRFTLNGAEVEAAVAPDTTLLAVLREQLDLTGTKCVCAVGECGACTVLVDGVPRLSCCTLAASVRGRTILTIEGLAARGILHPLQQAFVERGAIQCGYCTPGSPARRA